MSRSCRPADPYALDRDPRTETKPINYRLRGAVLPAECDVGVLAGKRHMRGSRALYASSECHFQFRRRCAVLPMCREMPHLLPSMMPSPPWRRVWRKSFETRLPYLDRVRGVALPRYSPAFSLRRLMYQAPETDRARHLAFPSLSPTASPVQIATCAAKSCA